MQWLRRTQLQGRFTKTKLFCFYQTQDKDIKNCRNLKDQVLVLEVFKWKSKG